MAQLLVLRPEPGASRTVARAAAMGLVACKMPLFDIVPLSWTAPDPAGFDALLLTSANAVRCAGPALQSLRAMKVHAVGEATAAAAREAGFAHVAAGVGGVGHLLARLSPPLSLLHLCGADVTNVAVPGIVIDHVPVYAARVIEAPAGLAGALADTPVVMLHSPRAAARFAALVSDRAGLFLAAISAAAAEAAGPGWADVVVAERPGDEALLAIAARLCEERARK